MTPRQLEKLNTLKVNILEEQYPFFTDGQLENLLKENKWDVKMASYKACQLKAQVDGLKIGPLQVDSNDEFWLKLARFYQPVRTLGMQRSDG